MPRDYYGQSSRRPRLPLLQDPINNADPEAMAMLEQIMSKTMGRGGRNPYSDPGFSQGPTRPRPAGKSATPIRDTEALLPRGMMGPQTGADFHYMNDIMSTGWNPERANRPSEYQTPSGVSQFGRFGPSLAPDLQPYFDSKALDAAQRYSVDELRFAARSGIYANQNLDISPEIAEAALRLLRNDRYGMIDSPLPPPRQRSNFYDKGADQMGSYWDNQ